MTNTVRGEHSFEVPGVGKITLLLNMGALAKIESGMGCQNVGQLIHRMVSMGVNDILLVLHSMAVAGGHRELTIEEMCDWPPIFTEYSKAIQETLINGGFINRPVEQGHSVKRPKTKSQ